MMVVAGVDGCRRGWVALCIAWENGVARSAEVLCEQRFDRLLEQLFLANAIAVDMPIGLLEGERACLRPCDRLARQLLGSRHSTIFAPPTRPMLSANSYSELRHRGLSIQAYNILPRIRELDLLLSPTLQKQVWESHPELSFLAATGRPIAEPKHTQEGRHKRCQLLRCMWGISAPAVMETLEHALTALPRSWVTHADLLDAAALAWSALRHAMDNATTLVDDPYTDTKGLLMAIRY